MQPIVSLRNVSFQYRSLNEPTLKQINLDIYPGEKVLIAGRSGSGKSTLAHCLNGLIPFHYEGSLTGELIVKGRKPSEAGIFATSEAVGTILQDQDKQFVGLTVGEDVAFVLENENVPAADMKERVGQALQAVDMLASIDASPYDLSGGQKQRVSIAGIWCTDADILLFDEPLANLDPASGEKAIALIDDIHREANKTIIIVEHRIEDVLHRPVDRIVLLDCGEIVASGTPDELLGSGVLKRYGIRQPLYVEALQYAGFSEADAGGGKDECDKDECGSIESGKRPPEWSNLDSFRGEAVGGLLTRWMEPGTEARRQSAAARGRDRGGEELLEIDRITFGYDKTKPVLTDVSFRIGAGETVALLGNNGAGKSTLSALITGMLKTTNGDIRFRGESIKPWSVAQRGRRIGYAMQNPNHMITQQIVKDEAGLGLLSAGLDPETLARKVEDALRTCGLYPYRNWPVSALSYGQKKRLTIASILVLGPELIILDEPTAGQDYRHYREFMEWIAELAASGTAFLIITHDMHLALEYADRAVVLSGGRVIGDGDVAQLLADEAIVSQASLKMTSLAKLARQAGLDDPAAFIRHYIAFERGAGGR
ncbi:DUF3744 domain-containing protein [Paenibacillus thermotolerans]|uniref:DUF3744 domain-containing protein n=1 Tax=Paenibacillus thermotolerans TaxID=3027807 RepID=UPI0023681CC9|nr:MULTISPECIES: DUF3744 domain-containing protein [unclassified Paenibacillus]